MAVFVKVSDHQDISRLLDQVRGKLAQARDLLETISALKKQEDEEIGQWHRELEDVEERLNNVDRALTEHS